MMNLGTFMERKKITFIVQLWLRGFFRWLQLCQHQSEPVNRACINHMSLTSVLKSYLNCRRQSSNKFIDFICRVVAPSDEDNLVCLGEGSGDLRGY